MSIISDIFNKKMMERLNTKLYVDVKQFQQEALHIRLTKEEIAAWRRELQRHKKLEKVCRNKFRVCR